MRHDWRDTDPDRQLWLRLCWLYGKDKAALIMSGYDEATEADLMKWRQIGGKSVKDADGRKD